MTVVNTGQHTCSGQNQASACVQPLGKTGMQEQAEKEEGHKSR